MENPSTVGAGHSRDLETENAALFGLGYKGTVTAHLAVTAYLAELYSKAAARYVM